MSPCRKAFTGQADGTCAAIKANTAPNNQCNAAGDGVCQLPGVCDGSGACVAHTGLECVPSSCDSTTTQVNASKCDAMGQRVGNGTSPCAPYKCDGTRCLTSCVDATDVGIVQPEAGPGAGAVESSKCGCVTPGLRRTGEGWLLVLGGIFSLGIRARRRCPNQSIGH